MNARRATCWHVGRAGEVAGGMTQVVNGYLQWSFRDFDVQVIRSRDGSRGPGSWLLFMRAIWQVARLARGRRDVFVVHLSQGGSFLREGLLLWLARRRGFGTVAHLHGSSFVAFAKRYPALVRQVLGSATRTIVLSEATREAAAALVPASRLVLLPNAVPPGKPRDKERLVVFGGAVTRRKGVDVLVEAWRRVGAGSGWQLQVAGPILEDDIVPAELPDARFLGATPHAALMALLDRATIAILPSRDEAMPMFILEAMARRCCVVSTSVGGIPAVLGGGRGFLVRPGDADALSTLLGLLLRDPDACAAVANVGLAAFEAEYSAAAVYPRIEQLWKLVQSQPDPSTSTGQIGA